jgi:hypothetical protein
MVSSKERTTMDQPHHPHWIVVSDPEGKFDQGSLIDETRNRQLTTRGVVTLPVAHDLFKKSGVGGFAFRAWGAGWPLDTHAPKMVCPLTMFCTKDYPILQKVREGDHFEGMLRLSADSGQHHPYQAGLVAVETPIDLRKLGQADARGGWDISGICQISAVGEGHYGFALYGAAPGLRVAWAAISLTAK